VIEKFGPPTWHPSITIEEPEPQQQSTERDTPESEEPANKRMRIEQPDELRPINEALLAKWHDLNERMSESNLQEMTLVLQQKVKAKEAPPLNLVREMRWSARDQWRKDPSTDQTAIYANEAWIQWEKSNGETPEKEVEENQEDCDSLDSSYATLRMLKTHLKDLGEEIDEILENVTAFDSFVSHLTMYALVGSTKKLLVEFDEILDKQSVRVGEKMVKEVMRS